MVPFRPLVAMAGQGSNDTECARVFYSSWRPETPTEVAVGIFTIGSVFGALHLIPLCLSYPSPSEKLLWKMAAVWITVTPCVAVYFTAVGGLVAMVLPKGIAEVIFIFLYWADIGLYLVARLTLFTLAFTTLHKLPPDTLQNVSWTTFLPHL